MDGLAGSERLPGWTVPRAPIAVLEDAKQNPPNRTGHGFTETRWTRVLLAQGASSPASREALEDLCARYWPAVYSFLRRRGFAPHDAEDLTQGFFAGLLRTGSIARAERSKGRFRSFLLGALQHFLTDEARKRSARKRGGGAHLLSNLPFPEIEERYLTEPDPGLTPEQVFDRRWAASLLERALQRIQSEFESQGQGQRFELMKRFLVEPASESECAALAPRLGITPKSACVAVSRLRGRYRDLVREEVLATVAEPGLVAGEFRDLFGPARNSSPS